MPRDFRSVDQETAWLPEEHLAWCVAAGSDSSDPVRSASVWGHGGKRACHPVVHAAGEFPSRKQDQATSPVFHKRGVGELEGLFVRNLMMARSAGLHKPGTISLDGTRVRAQRLQAQGAEPGVLQQVRCAIARPGRTEAPSMGDCHAGTGRNRSSGPCCERWGANSNRLPDPSGVNRTDGIRFRQDHRPAGNRRRKMGDREPPGKTDRLSWRCRSPTWRSPRLTRSAKR